MNNTTHGRTASHARPTSSSASTKPGVREHLEQSLRESIRKLDNGAPLPTARTLIERFHVSATTVRQVIRALEREGLLTTRPGAGTFVSKRPSLPPREIDHRWQTLVLGERVAPRGAQGFSPVASDVLDLGNGYPDASLVPTEMLRRVADRVSRQPGAWSRAPVEGVHALRAWFAEELANGARPEDTVIVGGGQSALSLVFRSLVPPGGAMIVESPTYFGALEIGRAAGIKLIPVPTDEEGVDPDGLASAVERSGAKVIYLQPNFANPTGVTLSSTRREQVMSLAARRGLFVIEDDYARNLCLEEAEPLPIARETGSEHVIYIRSLTKIVAPSLRVAGIVALGPVAKRIRDALAIDQWFISGFLQEVALDVVTSPAWPKHVRNLQTELRRRRDALLSALASSPLNGRLGYTLPKGGYGLWLDFGPEKDERQLVEAAAREKVRLTPGHDYFAAEPPSSYLRLSFAAADGRALIESVDRLSKAWKGQRF